MFHVSINLGEVIRGFVKEKLHFPDGDKGGGWHCGRGKGYKCKADEAISVPGIRKFPDTISSKLSIGKKFFDNGKKAVRPAHIPGNIIAFIIHCIMEIFNGIG